ncbi:MAG: phosphotransferase [Chloroflexi bacterium]|nr:phosphotransferase [Chloroflexota bacterium]
MRPDHDALLQLIRQHRPDFVYERVNPALYEGQFSTVLIVDDEWIFRFPKSAGAAADLARELEILPRLQGKLPLPIPEPLWHAADVEAGGLLFLGYRPLPGEPLLREKFAELQGEEGILETVAQDLARFLQRLHVIAPADIGLAPSGESAKDEWTRIGEEIREKLFPYMRADARADVASKFRAALNDADLWHVDERLIHGDFGTGNILYRDGRISGIIDFGFCGVGDPAHDLGALLASYGETFVERVFRHYPALRAGWPRARFYQSNYALIQALYALRDGDEAEFEDGISAYR